MELNGKKALVLGLGESGLAMAKWLARCGARVRVADSRSAPPQAAVLAAAVPGAELHCGPFAAASFAGIDLIAISPGVPAEEILVQDAVARGVPLLSEIELFSQALDALGPRPKILAITGTNGKTTVTALTGALCRAAGLDAEVAGNISPSALDALMARVDAGRLPQVWALELSSYQLEATQTLDADAAVVLNVTEDHLDRYAGMAEYAAAKARIYAGRGSQVINREDAMVRAMAIPGRHQSSFGLDAPRGAGEYGLVVQGGAEWLAEGDKALMPIGELRLTGRHNAANALAALALCRAIGLDMAPLLDALRRFEGLPHRVQTVAEKEGVRYIDDSKGTNVGATVAALAGLDRQAVLIAGGDGKGQDFSLLAPAVAARARAVVLIGRDAERVAQALAATGVPMRRAQDMDEAVRVAREYAKPGDAVLLSPACASLDMYRNYAHRAEAFVAAVGKLDKAGEGARC